MKNKILFVAPAFYDYHKVISSKLEELVGEVLFFKEEKLGFFYILLKNIHPKLIEYYQEAYFKRVWNRIKKEQNITHFFVIRGHKMPLSFINKVKGKFPNIKTIMYQWDSLKNNPYEYLIPHFQEVYTFDRDDFERNKGLKYLQLFYRDDIKNIKDKPNAVEFDFFCFSSFSQERYIATEKFIRYCEENNFKLKQFCYTPFKTYIKYKYLKKMDLKRGLLSFKPMSRSEYLRFLEKSAVVVDINHSTQSGLSMRVIEALGAGKKLLTTNHAIIKNPLFNKHNIQLLDIDNIKAEDFEGEGFTNIEDLHIDKWLNMIFANHNNEK